MTHLPFSLRPGRTLVDTPPRPVATRVLNALARLPLPAALGVLVLGGALVDATNLLFSRGLVLADWTFRSTLGLYAVLVPVGLIALWAPRRHRQNRLGHVAAVVAAVSLLVNVGLTVASIVIDPVLGGGEPVYPFWLLLFVAALGWLVSLLFPLTWILDRRAPRLVGPLMLAGFASTFVTFGVLTGALLAVSVIALRTGLEREDLPGRSDPQ